MRLQARWILLCCGWSMLAAVVCDSQAAESLLSAKAPAPALPGADELVDRLVKALGGRVTLEQLGSRVIEAEVEMSAVAGPLAVQVLSKAPNKQLSIITLPGGEEMVEGFDGTNGWVKNPFAGLSNRPAEELPKVRRDAQFNRELSFKKLYPDLTVVRADQVGGEEVYVVESHPAPRGLERFHLSKASGLILRQDSEFETARGRVVATALYDDYREVPEGVRLPHVIRITARPADGSEMTLTLKVKSVKHNVPLDDARFCRPAA